MGFLFVVSEIINQVKVFGLISFIRCCSRQTEDDLGYWGRHL